MPVEIELQLVAIFQPDLTTALLTCVRLISRTLKLPDIYHLQP